MDSGILTGHPGTPAGLRSYAAEVSDELLALILELCAVPAPSNDEGRRAGFVCAWMEKHGMTAHIDAAQNCVYSLGDTGGPVIILMAHTDTVFPETEPFVPEVRGGRILCPGAGDDTANLAALMLAARYFSELGPAGGCGVLFVANSGEEGLGNLRGCRQLMRDYGGRTKLVISFDGGIGHACNSAVGSARYRVRVLAEGGHSFGRFGNSNAIHLLANIISELYMIDPPNGMGKITYNVGAVSGGTSVNSIAQSAEMLYEYRAERAAGLAFMEKGFNDVLDRHRPGTQGIEVELLGLRPGMGVVEPAAQKALEKRVNDATIEVVGQGVSFGAASTDCNMPFSMGIPAISTGCYIGGNAHRRDEWVDIASLKPGFEIMMRIIGGLWTDPV